MKNLASEMQSKSSLLSLALSLSTIVILVGIFGLVVVANHRQKKREQLKAILRAKNLGPVLESRKINCREFERVEWCSDRCRQSCLTQSY